MLIWKGEENRDECVQTSQAFLEICRKAGLLGIVEAIVRAPEHSRREDWDRERALLEAAKAFGELKPDLYKTEVPYLGQAEAALIQDQAVALSEAVACPWVVLSSGVDAQRFPEAVAAACRGGASGFLAGRGIWQDAIQAEQTGYRKNLADISRPRLQKLADIVDEFGHSWKELHSD